MDHYSSEPMSNQSTASAAAKSPMMVALAGWLLPGAGYWLLGQRGRAMVTGITILILFVMGLAIGGVRVIDVPKFNSYGEYDVRRDIHGDVIGRLPLGAEIRAKPWSIAQILTGPVSIVGGAVSVAASRVDLRSGTSLASVPHARMWEIPVLYTAVAGMLNLIVIIDAAHRARHAEAA